MWSRLLLLALLLLPAQAFADVKEKVAALAPSGLVLVVDAEGKELVAQNADEPFVPASVTKIVTAWLAIEVLSADYRFETRFYLDSRRVFYVRGGGDPFLISEELALLAPALVAAVGKKPTDRHRARRELLPRRSPHSGRRGHQSVLRCLELGARGELQHDQRRAPRQQGRVRREADADHSACDQASSGRGGPTAAAASA